MTSAYESFGYVTAEALAMERPVVGTSVTGTVDIMNEPSFGRLFGVADAAEGAALCAALLADRAVLGEVGRMGRISVAERFSVANMRRRLEDVYASPSLEMVT
jgi:glycosyltransferase involved in cell wall biosynthesis